MVPVSGSHGVKLFVTISCSMWCDGDAYEPLKERTPEERTTSNVIPCEFLLADSWSYVGTLLFYCAKVFMCPSELFDVNVISELTRTNYMNKTWFLRLSMHTRFFKKKIFCKKLHMDYPPESEQLINNTAIVRCTELKRSIGSLTYFKKSWRNSVNWIHAFFYKHQRYKHLQPEISPKVFDKIDIPVYSASIF
jgi:hypothetical protein